MSDTQLEVKFPCCFCGGCRDGEEINLSASWTDDDGNEMWQAWGAHRECLIERFADVTRKVGGPIFGSEDLPGARSEDAPGSRRLPECSAMTLD